MMVVLIHTPEHGIKTLVPLGSLPSSLRNSVRFISDANEGTKKRAEGITDILFHTWSVLA